MAESNPLVSRPKHQPAPDHPMLMHAKMWKHVNAMPADEMAQKSKELEYGLPILGRLAGDPNVKAKDVIRAAADAAADGKIGPAQAVAMISAMPADPEKLGPWLRSLYAANLSAQVHLKAATMKGAPPAPAAPAAPQPAPMPGPAAPSQAPEAPL